MTHGGSKTLVEQLPVGVHTGVVAKPEGMVLVTVSESHAESGAGVAVLRPTCHGAAAPGGAAFGHGTVAIGTFAMKQGGALGGSGTPGGRAGAGGRPCVLHTEGAW